MSQEMADFFEFFFFTSLLSSSIASEFRLILHDAEGWAAEQCRAGTRRDGGVHLAEAGKIGYLDNWSDGANLRLLGGRRRMPANCVSRD